MTNNLATHPWIAIAVAMLATACTGTETPTNPSETGGSSPGTGGAAGGAINPSGGNATGGAANPSGGNATGGTANPSGGNATGGTINPSGGNATGGDAAGGVSTGGQTTGGNSGTATGGAAAGGQAGGCAVGPWAAADPAATGPFATVTENNVGPTAGVGADGGSPPQFTLFRPADMAQGGLCHPVITWGNGTGSTPSMYGVLLKHLASHGFVVIGSNSPNVSQGNPAPMLVGVTWVLEQNADPTSVMYQRIDPTHIGATGHSQGGFATTTAGADTRITTIAPLCGASTQRNLHGPAWPFCGGQDTSVPCSTIQSAFNNITNQPAMLADYLTADHGSWLTFYGSTKTPVEVALTAWMRVHLMGDTSLRSRFYGASCGLCQDAAWQVTQKMMDQ